MATVENAEQLQVVGRGRPFFQVAGGLSPPASSRLALRPEQSLQRHPITPDARVISPVVIRNQICVQIIYAHAMEIALTVMLAFVGFASCAVVMIRMWGPEALAFRKRSRQDSE